MDFWSKCKYNLKILEGNIEKLDEYGLRDEILQGNLKYRSNRKIHEKKKHCTYQKLKNLLQ